VNSLIVRTPEIFREKQGIDARILQRVVDLNLSEKRVQVEHTETGKTGWESFDQLLIATGALPIRPNIPGVNARGVYALNTLQSGIEARKAIDHGSPKNIVIVGGGYIGLEMAESFITRGLDVSIIEKTAQVMTTLDPDMGSLVAQVLQDAGAKIYLNESLKGLEMHGGQVRAVITDKQTLPADLVVLALGVYPNSALAAKAGIPTGEKGAIKVNKRMETEVQGVWAAGNCVESFHLVSRRPFYIALGTVANKQGRVAGINIAGGSALFPGVVGTATAKIWTVEVARTGLLENEVQQMGLSYASSRIEGRTRAGYYPGTGRITVKILAEKGTGRLIGGQIVGVEGAAKRIDVLAAALHGGFTVEEMVNLDLGYSPPFSPVWDPVLIAARQAVGLV